MVPTYTFADVDADPALTPDLVVVPGLTKPTGEHRSTASQLGQPPTRRRGEGPRRVQPAALVLAATGMLDGLARHQPLVPHQRPQANHPAVHWVRGRRWVEDGTVTTTAAVTSGVPAALHLVAELAGPAEAQRVADLHPELGWTPTETTDHPQGPLRASATGPSASTTSSRGSARPSASPCTTVSANSTRPPRSRCTASPQPPAPSRSQPVTPSAPGTASSCSPPASRRTARPRLVPASSCPAQTHPTPSTPRLRAHGPNSRQLAVEPLTGRPRSGRAPRRRRVHRCAAEPRRPHRRRHDPRDRENDRLPHHRAQPRHAAPVLADGPARPRQPRARRPHRTVPGLPRPTPTSTPPLARPRPTPDSGGAPSSALHANARTHV